MSVKKNSVIASFIILFLVSSANAAKPRDIKAIAGKAVREGFITPPPKDHDFTKIPPEAVYKEGELLVRFAPKKADGKQRNVQEKNQVLQSLGGGTLKRNYDIVPGLTLIELPPEQTVKDVLKKFNEKSEILYAEPNYQRKALRTVPNDPYFYLLWGLDNYGQYGGTPDADIDAPEAWDVYTGSSDIIVAVIDSGVDYNHDDLAANMWTNQEELTGTPGVDDDGNGYIDDIYGYDFLDEEGDPMDGMGSGGIYHGTHCAGTVGAVGNNGKGVVGVCWDVSIMALRFLDYYGYGNDSDAIQCINYAVAMGADVMSNSWGGGPYNGSLKDAIDSAGAADIVFVAAAGNDYGNNNDFNPVYPASYVSDNIIAVLATDRNDNMSAFSNYGRTSVDLGAPGTAIYSCKKYNSYQYLNGTSMATPHVAGACALLLSVDGTLSYSEIKSILIDTVDPLFDLYGRCVSDGRLNLNAAITDSRVKQRWMEVDPEQGSVSGAGGSTDVNVKFKGISIGTYQGNIIITFDDSGNTVITVPVVLNVQP